MKIIKAIFKALMTLMIVGFGIGVVSFLMFCVVFKNILGYILISFVGILLILILILFFLNGDEE